MGSEISHGPQSYNQGINPGSLFSFGNFLEPAFLNLSLNQSNIF